jgi:tungstate transport system ATP-binding protein
MGLTLEATGLMNAYNGQQVLKGCTATFSAGLTYTLQGPNGSGKSTLFRILSLLEKPDSGGVRYFGDSRPLNNDLDLRRRITLVLPQVGVFNTTVFNNVAYGLRLRGVAAGEVEARVDETLNLVGLLDKRRHRALELSSGETKRLGLARALVLAPEVLFLDEPTASLDPKNSKIIEDIMADLKSRRQATLVIITHDPAQAERLGDHQLLMREGKILGGEG